MVPVRDIPKVSTCVSTGRGDTVGISSMSLPVDEDILNSLRLSVVSMMCGPWRILFFGNRSNGVEFVRV